MTYPTRDDLAKPKDKKKKPMAPRRARELCDQVFSKIIRNVGHCERCGRSDVRLECSHWITRQYSNTRCDFENAFSMCSSCHRWWHDFPTDASDWAIEKRGRAVYDRLREAAYEPAKVDWVAELALLKEIAKREGIAV